MSGAAQSVTPARRARPDDHAPSTPCPTVRDGLAVMAFSAGVSSAIALVCLLLVGLGK
ncbi:MAG: hypothetical protein JWQ74_3084 [Marmoricola sp.]|nr:hypothetical protein [Marmoricola sp.]